MEIKRTCFMFKTRLTCPTHIELGEFKQVLHDQGFQSIEGHMIVAHVNPGNCFQPLWVVKGPSTPCRDVQLVLNVHHMFESMVILV